MKYYFKSNNKLYEDVGGEFLIRDDTGEVSHIETKLVYLFPELFLLKWSTR